MKNSDIPVAILSAPRSISTLQLTITGLAQSGFSEDLIVFSEPSDDSIKTEIETVVRPNSWSPRLQGIIPSPSGKFGNFQNYAQTLSDVFFKYPDSKGFLVVEDDVVFCRGLKKFCDHWLTSNEGCLSLYTPHLRQYIKISETPRVLPVRRENHVGCLAVLFSNTGLQSINRKILEASQTLANWPGGRNQTSVSPWERIACDAWLGQILRQESIPFYFLSHSLVEHYCPPGFESVGNSSLGNGPNAGCRRAYQWIGDAQDAFDFYFSENS